MQGAQRKTRQLSPFGLLLCGTQRPLRYQSINKGRVSVNHSQSTAYRCFSTVI